MDITSFLGLLSSNQIPDAWNETTVGRLAYSQFDIQSTDDLWRINSAIIYRDPIITNFNQQYFQKTGLTMYTLEGTCIDIARATQFVANANMDYNSFVIVGLNNNTGHAITMTFHEKGITINNLNVQVDYALTNSYNQFMSDKTFRTKIINEIITLINTYEGFQPNQIFMIQFGTNFNDINQLTVLYAKDLSDLITGNLPDVTGTIKVQPDSQLAVAKYIGDANIELKIILSILPYGIIILIFAILIVLAI